MDVHFPTGPLGMNPEVLSSPSTMVQRRLGDRAMSGDKRLVAGVRYLNMFTANDDYRELKVPSVKDLANRVGML